MNAIETVDNGLIAVTDITTAMRNLIRKLEAENTRLYRENARLAAENGMMCDQIYDLQQREKVGTDDD